MSADNHPERPLSPRALVLTTGLALVVGIVLALVAIIPAEYGKDPTGLGKLTGLDRLWGPKQVFVDPAAGEFDRAPTFAEGYRSHEVEFQLEGANSDDFEARDIEYKVWMEPGEVTLYEWEVIGARNPDDVYFDQHGHNIPGEGEEEIVVQYGEGYSDGANGAFTAPLAGVHGWFFRNGGLDPVTIRIRFSGYYDLIPPGEEGNLKNVEPLNVTGPAEDL